MALIELDLDAPPAPPPSRPPARYYRYVTVLVGVLLTLALGGAAPVTSVLWKRAGVVPLAGSSTTFQLLDGLLYTLDGNANRRTTTAYTLHPVRKLWSITTPLQLDPSGTVIQDGAGLTRSGRYTLLTSSNRTTVIDPHTGRIVWSTTTNLLAESGDLGIAQLTSFPRGTVYDPSTGDPGPLYWSEDGTPHTQPPDRTVLRAVDLGSGRELWRVTERGSVSVLPVPGDGTGFVVAAADRLSLLDAAGRQTRQNPLPRFAGNDVSFPELMGGLLVLRHDVSASGAGTATAYALDTLEQRWQVTEPAQDGSSGDCLGLPCFQDQGRLSVLDPATGAPRWYAPRNSMIIGRATDALELRGSSNTPLSLRDSRTGRVEVDLTAWQTLASGDDPDGPIVVFRAEPPTGRAGFGVLMPGARRVQPLGLSHDRVQECGADASVVACRTTDHGIEVWSYRA